MPHKKISKKSSRHFSKQHRRIGKVQHFKNGKTRVTYLPR